MSTFLIVYVIAFLFNILNAILVFKVLDEDGDERIEYFTFKESVEWILTELPRGLIIVFLAFNLIPIVNIAVLVITTLGMIASLITLNYGWFSKPIKRKIDEE